MFRFAATAIAFGVALAAAAAQVSAAPQAAGTPQQATAGKVAAANELESPLLGLINELRRQHGAPPLSLGWRIAHAADGHAWEMATQGFFSHDSPSGANVRDRLSHANRTLDQRLVGEVLLWRSPAPTPEQALQMWLNSPPHREVLLDPRFRRIGLAAVSALTAPGVFGSLDVTIIAADLVG